MTSQTTSGRQQTAKRVNFWSCSGRDFSITAQPISKRFTILFVHNCSSVSFASWPRKWGQKVRTVLDFRFSISIFCKKTAEASNSQIRNKWWVVFLQWTVSKMICEQLQHEKQWLIRQCSAALNQILFRKYISYDDFDDAATANARKIPIVSQFQSESDNHWRSLKSWPNLTLSAWAKNSNLPIIGCTQV